MMTRSYASATEQRSRTAAAGASRPVGLSGSVTITERTGLPAAGGRLAQGGVPGDRAVGVAPGGPGQRGAQRAGRGQARLAEGQRQHRLAATAPCVQGLVGGERGGDRDAGRAQPGRPGLRVGEGERGRGRDGESHGGWHFLAAGLADKAAGWVLLTVATLRTLDSLPLAKP